MESQLGVGGNSISAIIWVSQAVYVTTESRSVLQKYRNPMERSFDQPFGSSLIRCTRRSTMYDHCVKGGRKGEGQERGLAVSDRLLSGDDATHASLWVLIPAPLVNRDH
jgi:hypothetical protein